MKHIDTITHGYLDYMMGVFLIAAPFMFDLESENMEGAVFIMFGVLTIAYTVLTSYELGLVKIIPMKTHLFLDVLSGIILASSPWIFGFANSIYLPYLILGLVEIGAGLMTNPNPRN